MLISLIAAHTENLIIGDKNSLPWDLPEDMARFKAITKGKVVIMGRKTFESIGKILPGRFNIIITKHPYDLYVNNKNGFINNIENAAIATNIKTAIETAEKVGKLSKYDSDEAIIIGGAAIYRQALDLDVVDKMYLTIIRDAGAIKGDACFPMFNTEDWKLEPDFRTHLKDDKHNYSLTFQTFTRARKEGIFKKIIKAITG